VLKHMRWRSHHDPTGALVIPLLLYYDTGLFHPRPVHSIPLRFRSTRAHDVQARVCWRARTRSLSHLYWRTPKPGPTAPSVPGPCADDATHVPFQPIARLLKPYSTISFCLFITNLESMFVNPKDPRMFNSNNTLFHVSSSSSRHAQQEPKYNLRATTPSNSYLLRQLNPKPRHITSHSSQMQGSCYCMHDHLAC
jgi:hypothetical protein